MNKVAVLLDDHTLFTDSFTMILEKTEVFDEVHELNDPKKRLTYFRRNSRKEIYLFLDYYFGDYLVIEIVNEARKLNKKIKIIIVASVTQALVQRRIMTYKPDTFISKTSGFVNVVQCLKKLSKNENFYCPVFTQYVLEIHEQKEAVLSSREMEILKYFAQGFSVNETAETFFLSKHTIVSHRRKMMKKTKTNSITELLSYARKAGLIRE